MTQNDVRQYHAVVGTAYRLMAFHNANAVLLGDVLAGLPDPVPVPRDKVEELLNYDGLLVVEAGYIRVKHPFTIDV